MEKAQKEYYLNEKIKAIHQELGRKDDRTDEVEELKKKIETSGMPKEVREKAEQELRRLEAMPPVSAEATVSRNYIEWLVGVPWKKASRESKDLTRAEKILNDDHYGLEKVKERILEFLAVRQLVQKTKGSIICFVGPPGVGKTSLAKSIARSLNRQFVRLSLGGVRDEAEIRGPPADLHRRVPGPDHPDDEEGRHRQPGLPARRGRQDVLGLPGRSGLGAARGPGPGAEPLLRRPLPGRRVRPLEGHVHRHGQHRGPDPAGPEGPDGADPPLGLHAQREGRDRRGSSWCPSSARPTASRPTRSSSPTTTILARHRELHARGRRPEPRAGDRRRLPQGRPQDRPEEGRDAGAASRPRTSRTSSASPGSATAARARSRRSASRRAWPGPRPAARSS